MGERWQFEKDRIKCLIRSPVRRALHQEAPIEALFRVLESEGFVCQGLQGLEVFGMHGLWVVKDYLHRCAALDFWELNPSFAKLACHLGPRVNVYCGDSIQAIRSFDPRIGKYDLIHIDCPVAPFGPGYCEHFDLFPHVLGYLDKARGGVVVLNLVQGVRSDIDPAAAAIHAQRRREFYGTESVYPRQAIEVYRRYAAAAGLNVVYHCVVPKNEVVNNMGLVLSPRSSASIR